MRFRLVLEREANMKKNVFIAIFAVLILPRFTNAQGLGSITGRVTDPGGAAVGGAQVTATQEGTGFARSAVTETDGLYVIPSLNPAIYTLTVEAKGFSTAKQIAITLLADQTLTVNVALKLGSTTETVTVLSDALQVDTSTSTLKQVIEEQRIADLPLNGRNAAQLTLLVAGAVNSPNGGADQGATKTFPGAVTFSANGSRQNTISYQLDGGNYVDEYTNVNQPFPFPDALQEFSVQTTNYSAEYGSNAGGVVNVITKSGTNKFHGDAFEFNRNPAFNAQNFFATPTTPDRIKRNQFGGTLGGPIIHDKTFVFGGYQRTEFRNLVLGSQKVVGQTDITNFLSPKTAACPTCGAPTTAATGPAGVIDPAVATLLGIDPNTGAALSSPKTRSVFERLRQEFAMIIIDAPPTLPIADSHILSGLSDKVVFVVRAKQTPRELFQHAVESFDTTNVLGAVLNDVDYHRSRYAYAYEYYKKTAA